MTKISTRYDFLKGLSGDSPEDHPRWKAEKAGYRAKHYRMVKLYGKADHCENTKCLHPDYHRFEWACLDDEYTTDRDTWAMLCVWCHRALDRKGVQPVFAGK